MSETLRDKADRLRDDVSAVWTALQGAGGMIPHKLNMGNLQDVIGQITSLDKWQSKGLFLYNYTGAYYDFYTTHEVNDMTELPAPPSGATGWSMTLADIKTALQTNNYVIVLAEGAYTADFAMEFKLTSSSYLSPKVCFRINGSPEDVVLRWGDGTSSLFNNAGRQLVQHTYSSTGTYLVTITTQNSTTLQIGYNDGDTVNSGDSIIGKTGNTSEMAYRSYIGDIYASSKVYFDNFAFAGYTTGSGSWWYTSIKNTSLYNYPSVVPTYFMPGSEKTEIILPNNVTRIKRFAFRDSRYLTSFVMPEGVELEPTDSYILANCTALTSISLPNSLKIIPEGMFAECSNLTSVNGLDHVRSVGKSAFTSCSKLRIISSSFLNSLQSIGSGAFNGCGSYYTEDRGTLEYVCTNNNADVAYDAFTSMNIFKKFDSSQTTKLFKMMHCQYMEEFVFPNNMPSYNLDTMMFAYCYRLHKLHVPEGVTTLPNQFLYEVCDSYNGQTDFVFPNSLTTISSYALAYMGSRSTNIEIVIPPNVTTIQGEAMRNSSFKKITFSGQMPNLTQTNSVVCSMSNSQTILDLSNCVSIPTLSSSSVISVNSYTRVIVPDSLYDNWIIAPVWSSLSCTYVKASEA